MYKKIAFYPLLIGYIIISDLWAETVINMAVAKRFSYHYQHTLKDTITYISSSDAVKKTAYKGNW